MTFNPTIIIAGIAILLLVVVWATYNSLVMLRNKVNEAFSTMDVFLQKRHDLIPNLVAVVKGYAEYESATLEKVTKLRSEAQGVNDKVDGEIQISEALGKIMIVAENYPQLMASQQFLGLQDKLATIEEDLAFSRRYYNGSVREYNNKCQMFPFNLIAGIFGFKAMHMFEVESVAARKNVEVDV